MARETVASLSARLDDFVETLPGVIAGAISSAVKDAQTDSVSTTRGRKAVEVEDVTPTVAWRVLPKTEPHVGKDNRGRKVEYGKGAIAFIAKVNLADNTILRRAGYLYTEEDVVAFAESATTLV